VLVAHPRYALPLIPMLVAAGASGLAALWSRCAAITRQAAGAAIHWRASA